MLQIDPKQRMKLGEVFRVSWLCEGIKKFLQKKFQEESSEKGLALYRQSSKFERKDITKSVFHFRNTVLDSVNATGIKVSGKVESKHSIEEFLDLQDKIKSHKFVTMEEFIEELINILHKG